MKIKEFKVLMANGTTDSNGTSEITKIVIEHIKEGWSLQGGTTSVVTSMNYISFIQAVVKYED